MSLRTETCHIVPLAAWIDLDRDFKETYQPSELSRTLLYIGVFALSTPIALLFQLTTYTGSSPPHVGVVPSQYPHGIIRTTTARDFDSDHPSGRNCCPTDRSDYAIFFLTFLRKVSLYALPIGLGNSSGMK